MKITSVSEISNERERERSWSSLPDLLLWMIKDRLDIFGNHRFAAVCRDWQLASTSYPKTLHSVGDGVPWLWHTRYVVRILENGLPLPLQTSSREFISVTRKHKFQVDMPEFKNCFVYFSKDGWILLRRGSSVSGTGFVESPLVVNPLTGARIKLPELTGIRNYNGVFTTCGGYPRRVFIFIGEQTESEVTIKTACPGDEVWTSHNFPPMNNIACGCTFAAVGKKICSRDTILGNLTVFDLANHNVKAFPPITKHGFIAEHDGELAYIDWRISRDAQSFSVYRYNDASFSWERLNDSEVKDTSWYFRAGTNCITMRGSGLKVYHLRQVEKEPSTNFETCVNVHDLRTGTLETTTVPFLEHNYMCWIAIG